MKFEIEVAEVVLLLKAQLEEQKQELFLIKIGTIAIIIMLLILTIYVSIRLGGPLF